MVYFRIMKHTFSNGVAILGDEDEIRTKQESLFVIHISSEILLKNCIIVTNI